MHAQQPSATEPPTSIAEEMADRLLSDWSALRLYVRRRKAGAPADDTFDTLLSELVRVRLPKANVRTVVQQLTTPRA